MEPLLSANAASPDKPEWDVSSDKSRARIAAWVNAMLDAELEAAAAAAGSPESVATFVRAVEPAERVFARLDTGEGDAEDQARAAYEWRLAQDEIARLNAPKKPGPVPQPKIDRNAQLFGAARDLDRIMALWREHYGRVSLPFAIDLAATRWADDAEERADLGVRLEKTIKKSKARNFRTP